MARYFFDLHDGTMQFDSEGTECATLDDARDVAKRLLPAVVRDELIRDGDRLTYAVLVSDEDHRPVYSATLTYTGLWLIR
ncbi:DUF6894 family protein [Methylobacterium oxalidis]|uniref:DUF6894 family protein n=1 Tax=Methylobacterium oxalidis TaxID=944322 RepID=UPI003314964E